MNKYKYVFRFINDDILTINKTLKKIQGFNSEKYFYKSEHITRENPHSSPLEFLFEENLRLTPA